MSKIVRYAKVSDEELRELIVTAVTAKSQDNFIGYASSCSTFHHTVASMAIELECYRSAFALHKKTTQVFDPEKCPTDCDHKYNTNCALSCYSRDDIPVGGEYTSMTPEEQWEYDKKRGRLD